MKRKTTLESFIAEANDLVDEIEKGLIELREAKQKARELIMELEEYLHAKGLIE